MMVAVFQRHRRLLALCACSACTHLAVLGWIGARTPHTPAIVPGDVDALRVTLAAAVAPPRVTASPPPARAAVPAEPSPTVPAAIPAPRGAAGAPAPAPSARPQPADAPEPVAAAADTDPGPAEASSLATAGVQPIQMPGRYRIRPPAPVILRYAVVRKAAGAPDTPAGAAFLDWRTDGSRYLLAMDGVLGALTSEGMFGDAGIAPRRAAERRAPAELATTFDPAAGEVRFGAGGTTIADHTGIQDRASLLMQLAGIGLGDPEQVKDVLEVVVAGSDEGSVARLRVVGLERIDTGVGTLDAWHLAGMVAPGRPRLDVWLAPARDWLPVQVRATGADGAVTQTLSAIDPGVPLP